MAELLALWGGRLVVRTRGFHPRNRSSILRRPTMEIKQSDLQVDVYSSGINVPRRVEITHKPTGFVGIAENRSQLKAREIAMKSLRDMVELADTAVSKTAA